VKGNGKGGKGKGGEGVRRVPHFVLAYGPSRVNPALPPVPKGTAPSAEKLAPALYAPECNCSKWIKTGHS